MNKEMKMTEVWKKNSNARIDVDAEFVTIIDETPLAVHVQGECGSFGTYVLGRFEFFNNFTKMETR